jgi:hypothetical protein
LKSPIGIWPDVKIISARPRWKAGSFPKINPFADKSMKKNARVTAEMTRARTISNVFPVGLSLVKTMVASSIH